MTNQEPRKTIGYCLENNELYCSPNPRWRYFIFSQSGAELRIQDGGAHESRPCWKTAHQPRQRTWDRSHGFPWRNKSCQGHAKNVMQLQNRYVQCPMVLNDRGPSGKRPD